MGAGVSRKRLRLWAEKVVGARDSAAAVKAESVREEADCRFLRVAYEPSEDEANAAMLESAMRGDDSA